MELLSQSVLIVDSHEPIRTEQQQVVILFNSHLSDLGFRNDEPLQIKVTDCPRYGQFSVDSLHSIFRRDPAPIINDALALVLSRRSLINCHLTHLARFLRQKGARVAQIGD